MIIQIQCLYYFLYLEVRVILFNVYSPESAICNQAPSHKLTIFGQNRSALTKSRFNHLTIVFLPKQQSIIANQPQPSSQFANIIICNEFNSHSLSKAKVIDSTGWLGGLADDGSQEIYTQRIVPSYFNIISVAKVAIATKHLKLFISNQHDSND